MDRRALAFPQAMVAMGIGHIVEALAQLDEAIDKAFGDLKMRVGLSSAMDNQQITWSPSAKFIAAARRYQ